VLLLNVVKSRQQNCLINKGHGATTQRLEMSFLCASEKLAFGRNPSALSSSAASVSSFPQDHIATQSDFPRRYTAAGFEDWQSVYAAIV
jgi:hypothetical protein